MLVPLSYEPFLLLQDYNFLNVEGTWSDPAEITDDVHAHKFTNHEHNTRILIAYDPTENNP